MKPGFTNGNARKWATLSASEKVTLVLSLYKEGWTIGAMARLVQEDPNIIHMHLKAGRALALAGQR